MLSGQRGNCSLVTGGRCFWQISEKTPLSPCPINIASVCEVTQWVGWTRVRLGAGIWQQDGAELVETWPLEEGAEANEEAMQVWAAPRSQCCHCASVWSVHPSGHARSFGVAEDATQLCSMRCVS